MSALSVKSTLIRQKEDLEKYISFVVMIEHQDFLSPNKYNTFDTYYQISYNNLCLILINYLKLGQISICPPFVTNCIRT